MFIEFVKRMLNWCPSRRCAAKELMKDPWLDEMRDLIENPEASLRSFTTTSSV